MTCDAILVDHYYYCIYSSNKLLLNIEKSFMHILISYFIIFKT